MRGLAEDVPYCSSEDVAMTVDRCSTRFAPDRGEASSRFGWLTAQEIDEAVGGKADDGGDVVSGALAPPPVYPAWPRVYPGL